MPFEQVPASPFEFPLVGEFSAATTCLLVIDLQRDFTEEGGYMTAMGYDITPCAAPLKPVAAVLAACRKAGMHVIHTRQGCRRPALKRRTRQRHRRSLAAVGAQSGRTLRT